MEGKENGQEGRRAGFLGEIGGIMRIPQEWRPETRQAAQQVVSWSGFEGFDAFGGFDSRICIRPVLVASCRRETMADDV